MTVDTGRYPKQPLADMPYAWGGPVCSALLRCNNADFVVEELSDLEPSGSGEHLMLWVEKDGANTDWVAGQLAQLCGVEQGAVGYAGRKDRHAMTRQWFSIHLPGQDEPDLPDVPCEGARILRRARHQHKLRTGALEGNRFLITLREVNGEPEALEARIKAIADQGFPNWFGEQRFGRDGGNLPAAAEFFSNPRQRIKRNLRSLYISAARSWLFNLVLAERVADGSWNRVIPGDRLLLFGSGSYYPAHLVDGDPEARVARGEMAITGPMWGRGRPDTTKVVGELERRIADAWPELRDGLEHVGLRQERRVLVVKPGNLKADWPEHNVLLLSFELPAGAFATALLRELVEFEDRGGANPVDSAV